MVVVDGVRYRPEDAPKESGGRDEKPAENKMRRTRSTARKSAGAS